MTTTTIKPKKSKSAPFQSQTKQSRALRSSVTAAPLPVPSLKEQEHLSDWDHAS